MSFVSVVLMDAALYPASTNEALRLVSWHQLHTFDSCLYVGNIDTVVRQQAALCWLFLPNKHAVDHIPLPIFVAVPCAGFLQALVQTNRTSPRRRACQRSCQVVG